MSLPLAIAVGTSDTTITVVGTILSTVGPGVLQIGSEEISFSGCSSSQYFNCVRAFNGTSAAAHARNAAVTDITSNTSVSLPLLRAAGAPTDGVTGAGSAAIGSEYVNASSGSRYLNTGTMTSPVWTLIEAGSTDQGITQLTGAVTAGPGNGSQAAVIPLASQNILVGNVSNQAVANTDVKVDTTHHSVGVNTAPATDGSSNLAVGGAIRATTDVIASQYLYGSAVLALAYTSYSSQPCIIRPAADYTTGIRFTDSAQIEFAAFDTINKSMVIGSSGAPDTKAVLDLQSTVMGFLPPRMTNTQRDAISSPPEGLVIYSTSDHALEFYNGSTWKQVATV